MNKSILYFLFGCLTFIFSLFTISDSKGQCGGFTISGQDIGIVQPQLCAPVPITLNVSYTFYDIVDPAKVQVRILWNNASNDIETLPAIETVPGSKKFDVSRSKVYAAGPSCSYEPTTYLVYDGVVCLSTVQSQLFSAWSTDEFNPGTVEMNPPIAEFCPSTPIVNFVFEDNTTFNCNIGIEPDKPNRQNRWVQFIYNTDPNNGNLIEDVTVAGTPVTDGAGNFLTEIAGPIDIIPFPADGPIHVSLPISAPAGSPVGRYFEVTMRNWNVCNPYNDPTIPGPPSDVANGDHPPVITTAILLIVPPPAPVFTPRKSNLGGPVSYQFCPGERIYFNNATPNGPYTFNWSFITPVGSDPIPDRSGRHTDTKLFVDPGTYRVTLSVTDNNASGVCVSSTYHDIEIIVAPTPAMEISVDDGTGMAVTTGYDFCEIGAGYDFSIANQTTVPTGASPEYTWRLYRFSNNTTITKPMTTDINERFEFTLIDPGAYRVSLTARDAATGCANPVEQIINIYNTPEADFEIVDNVELCVGKQTTFNDLSKFSSPKGFADDAIVAWEWWFDYNGNPASASESSDEDPITIFTTARDYDVRLLVTSKYGCTDDTIVRVTVNPVAKAEITVDDPDDCAPFEPTFTNVHANAQFPVVVEKYRWFSSYEGVPIFDTEQFPDGSSIFVDTFAYAFPYTRTDNQDQIYKIYMEAYAVGGCVTIDSIEITVFPSAAAKFTSNYNPLASNCTPVLVSFSVDNATKNLPFSKEYSWSVLDSDGVAIDGPSFPDASAETFSYSFTNPDSIAIKNYEVVLDVTSSNGPCLQPYSQQIKVNPTPSSKFTVVENRQCEIITMTFDANQKGLSASNYYWTFREISTGAPKSTANDPIRDDNFALQFARGLSDSTVEVTLRTRNFAGCESTGPSVQYFIPALEQFEVLLDTMSVMPKCFPQEITFYNNSLVPAGTTFELKIQKGSGSPFIVPAADINGNLVDPSFNYTFQEAGQYVVTLMGSYIDGCKDEASLNIVINPAVEAIFSPDVTTVCPETPVYLNEASSPKAIITNKNWTITNLGDNSIAATLFGSQLFYSFADPGTYEIKLEVISNNGCRDITTHNINVLPQPDFTISYNTFSCDQTFNFEITANPLFTITEYKWVWGDGKTETTIADSMSHTYLNRNGFMGPDQYTGTVTAKASTGCEFTRDFTVNLRQDVSASFLMDKDKGCAPLAVVFDDVSLGTDFSDQEWYYREFSPTVGAWTTFDGISNVFSNIGSANKVYQVRLNAKNIAGDCSDDWTKTVMVYPQITADFNFVDDDKCSPYEVVFNNNSNGLSNPNVTYTWNWGDGTDEEVTSDATVSHVFLNSSYSVPRNFKVKLTADGSTCSAVIEKTVTVNPAIRASIEPSDTIGCAPLALEFINDFNGVSNGHSWWVINMNNNQTVDGFEDTDPNYYQTFENKTFDTIRYKVMYEGLSAEGCTVSDSAFVLVYPEITPSFTATPSEQNLPNSTVTINNTTFDNQEYIYFWDFGNGDTSDERNPAPYDYGTYGVFNIILTVTDQYNKCPKVFSQMVTINPTIPVIDFEYDPGEGCGPLTVQFTNKSEFVDIKTLVWDFGDNSTSFSNAENPTYTYYEPGEYTVTLKGSNEIGITITETKKYIINVYDNPRANFRIRQRMPVYMPDSVIFLNESERAVSYLWDFGDGTTSTEFEPKHAYAQPGDYIISLVAINEDGCVDTLRREGDISIEGKFEVKIPNVFTPNGDGDNDIFVPKMQGVTEYNLMIYNRWGELLFESKSQEIGWDGYYRGLMSMPGVYIYKLDLKFSNGERTSKFGDVTLLR